MDHSIKNPQIALVMTLAGLSGHFKKSFCFPTQTKIIELHWRRTGRRQSLATLNRHLRALVAEGWIQRIRRHRRGRDGQLELHSTCYTFLRRAIRYLKSTGHGLAGLMTRLYGNPGDFRILSSERISVPGQDQGAAALTVGPPNPEKEAWRPGTAGLQALKQIKATLSRKK